MGRDGFEPASLSGDFALQAKAINRTRPPTHLAEDAGIGTCVRFISVCRVSSAVPTTGPILHIRLAEERGFEPLCPFGALVFGTREPPVAHLFRIGAPGETRTH